MNTSASKKKGAANQTKILELLAKNYPDAQCALTHRNPWELLTATILSAQCTDARVNMVTPALFRRFPTVKDMAEANLQEIETLVQSTGFFHAKAKSILGAAQAIVKNFQGQVPRKMDDLLTLPGVARKTGNVVLGTGFGIISGIVVDTHVSRLAQRWQWTKETDPPKIEQDLMGIVPREDWIAFSHQAIWHGRKICQAKKPLCSECPLVSYCPSADTTAGKTNPPVGKKGAPSRSSSKSGK